MTEKPKLKFGKEVIKAKVILVEKPKKLIGVGTAGDSAKTKLISEGRF